MSFFNSCMTCGSGQHWEERRTLPRLLCVSQWLDSVLPADLYARTATSSAAADQAFLPPDFVQAAAAVPGVARVQGLRVRSISLAADQPAVSLIARPLDQPARQLPMVETP